MVSDYYFHCAENVHDNWKHSTLTSLTLSFASKSVEVTNISIYNTKTNTSYYYIIN